MTTAVNPSNYTTELKRLLLMLLRANFDDSVSVKEVTHSIAEFFEMHNENEIAEYVVALTNPFSDWTGTLNETSADIALDMLKYLRDPSNFYAGLLSEDTADEFAYRLERAGQKVEYFDSSFKHAHQQEIGNAIAKAKEKYNEYN